MSRNHFARRHPYTDIWMNTSVCSPCLRALKKGGRHRLHECGGGFIAGSAYVFCDCECIAISTKLLQAFNDSHHNMAFVKE